MLVMLFLVQYVCCKHANYTLATTYFIKTL